MKPFKDHEVWFITGSQHLYGEETLRQVADHARDIAGGLNDDPLIPVRLVAGPVVTTSDEIEQVIREVNSAPSCAGVVFWMHTFSPAKMWIRGLKSLQKPFAHLHTQYNRDIPWETIDMDFMNLNQSAHGDREFGFMVSRLRLNRTVIAGHWKEPDVRERLGRWTRAASALAESRALKVARFGDNMREVAVTEGDKVESQITFGFSVNGYGVGDLVEHVQAVSPAQVQDLIDVYREEYTIAAGLLEDPLGKQRVEDAALIELGMRSFLETGGFRAFTTTFENLHGLKQLPGLAVQRLMQDGYGFGAEGDWKTAAMTRIMKVMASGLDGGTSFMEDYTYHLEPGNMRVLGSHMLEVCPSIASDTPRLEVHDLGIGGKDAPARLTFNVPSGPALNASLIDMGNRFRLLLNEVDSVQPDFDLPKLPVARVLWKPLPDLKTAASAWIYAGGAHHTVFSQVLTVDDLEMFAEMSGIECLIIDRDTSIRSFKKELRWNEAAYR